MDVRMRDNGNLLINGREYICREKHEEYIEQLQEEYRTKIISAIIFIVSVIAAFGIGYFVG